MMFEMNRLYNIDCMEAMKEIPDGYFELAIADPPYGISSISGEPWNHTKSNPRGAKAKHTFCGAGKLKNRTLNVSGKHVEAWDIAPKAEYFTELRRVSQNQIIWGGNYFDLPPTRCFIVWDKIQPFKNFSAAEYAWTSFDRPASMYRERVTSSVPSAERIHPTQKPVKLYAWLLGKYAKPGDKILDTHAGSASSLIACYRAGHEFLGFELDTGYFEKAQARLDAEMAQGTIFNELEVKNAEL